MGEKACGERGEGPVKERERSGAEADNARASGTFVR